MSKTHWKQFHNPDYIGAYAFQPGERKVVMITGASQERVMGNSGKADECLVVTFAGDVKPLICNVTNAKAISKVAGSSYIEDWQGTHIELFVTQVSAFGEMVDAVRVKQTPPKQTKPELTPDHPAWSDAKKHVAGGFTREKVEKKYVVSDDAWKQLQEAE